MSEKKRARPDQRQRKPRRMVEGDLDRQIVKLVYDYRILSQVQLQRLMGKSKPQIQRLLRRLYDHHYLERVFMPVSYFGAPPTLYILDREGRNCMVRQRIDDFSTQPKKTISGFFIYHTHALNEVRIAVTEAAAKHNFEVVKWLTENELKQDYDRVPTPGESKPISLIPDSYFVLRDPKGVTNYFVELDRGTMNLKRFKSKIAAYVAYYKPPRSGQANLFEKRFGYKSFRVLTVVDGVGVGRVENLGQMSAKVAGSGRRFWFAHLSDLQQNDPLTAPIWRVGDDKQSQALLS